eukprot:gene32295-16862_t
MFIANIELNDDEALSLGFPGSDLSGPDNTFPCPGPGLVGHFLPGPYRPDTTSRLSQLLLLVSQQRAPKKTY